MSEQNDLPDWLKALRPAESTPPPAEQPDADIPDWLKAMRPGAGGEGPAKTSPPAPSAPMPSAPAEQAPAAAAPLPTEPSEFDILREKATAMPLEVEDERPFSNSAIFQVVNSLKPQQRFILSLFLFLNVSLLGCFILMILGRISLVR
jgi:hypothetical protein